VFYTDGIVEAQDERRALFGFERLEALVREHGDLPPDQLIARVMAAVDAFAGRAPQHDDMTIVAVKVM
jgi:sigma-B regulation protein RsbU (phosphoserine phosphatase)